MQEHQNSTVENILAISFEPT